MHYCMYIVLYNSEEQNPDGSEYLLAYLLTYLLVYL